MPVTTLLLLIPSLCMIVPAATIYWWIKHQEAADRRKPLADELLRQPGETLSDKLRDDSMDIALIFLSSALVPAIGIMLLLTTWVDPERIQFNAMAVIAALVVLAGVGWSVRKTVRLFRQLAITRRGLEGELATAQLLSPLLATGWQLFHDLPMKRSNIDHVLVGPTGVYAIETKYRSKRLSLKGKEGAQAEYDGSSIRFAGGANEHLPVQQVQAVADELSKWLHGKLGEPVNVVPVVALPGWFVTITKRITNGQPHVINPKAHGLFQKRAFQMEPSLQVRVGAALKELAVRAAPGANQ